MQTFTLKRKKKKKKDDHQTTIKPSEKNKERPPKNPMTANKQNQTNHMEHVYHELDPGIFSG